MDSPTQRDEPFSPIEPIDNKSHDDDYDSEIDSEFEFSTQPQETEPPLASTSTSSSSQPIRRDLHTFDDRNKEDDNSDDENDGTDKTGRRRKSAVDQKVPRNITVYDVVAGRVLRPQLGFNLRSQWVQSYRDDDQDGRRLYTPDDYLLMLARGSKDTHPDHGAEPPIVVRDEATIDKLPDSMLLEALHYYAGEYYRVNNKLFGMRRMDETALLALGILVEEYIKELIGTDGHLTYAKRANPDDPVYKPHKRQRVAENPGRESSPEEEG